MYADKIKEKEYFRKYYQTHKKEKHASQKKSRLKHREEILTRNQGYYRKIKDLVLEKYGHQCACCGEAQWEFLAIDHINGNGRADRKNKRKNFYIWLRDNPVDNKNYRILCHNCNAALAYYGYCPHNGGKS